MRIIKARGENENVCVCMAEMKRERGIGRFAKWTHVSQDFFFIAMSVCHSNRDKSVLVISYYIQKHTLSLWHIQRPHLGVKVKSFNSKNTHCRLQSPKMTTHKNHHKQQHQRNSFSQCGKNIFAMILSYNLLFENTLQTVLFIDIIIFMSVFSCSKYISFILAYYWY